MLFKEGRYTLKNQRVKAGCVLMLPWGLLDSWGEGMTQMIISQDSLLGDNDLPAGSGKIIWMCIYHMCCCVLALIYVWIYLCLYIYLLYNAKLYSIFQNLLIFLVSLHTLTAWKGQILWRKENQLPGFFFFFKGIALF